jgi:hypothetical protein
MRYCGGPFVPMTASMSTEEKICDCCGKPLDADPIVVTVHADGSKIVRHRDCQMLELLERA